MKRKPLLSIVHEFLGALPRLFKHRSVQLIFIGIGIIVISAIISYFYNVSQWMLLIFAFISLAFFFLGFIDLAMEETWEKGTVEGEEKSEYKKIMQKLELIEKEIKEIKNRLKK